MGQNSLRLRILQDLSGYQSCGQIQHIPRQRRHVFRSQEARPEISRDDCNTRPRKPWLHALTDLFYVCSISFMFYFRLRISICGSTERALWARINQRCLRRRLRCKTAVARLSVTWLPLSPLYSLVLWNATSSQYKAKALFGWGQSDRLYHVSFASFTDVPVCSQYAYQLLASCGSQCHHVGPWGDEHFGGATRQHLPLRCKWTWLQGGGTIPMWDTKGCGLNMGHTWASFGNWHSQTLFAENHPDLGVCRCGAMVKYTPKDLRSNQEVWVWSPWDLNLHTKVLILIWPLDHRTSQANIVLAACYQTLSMPE